MLVLLLQAPPSRFWRPTAPSLPHLRRDASVRVPLSPSGHRQSHSAAAFSCNGWLRSSVSNNDRVLDGLPWSDSPARPALGLSHDYSRLTIFARTPHDKKCVALDSPITDSNTHVGDSGALPPTQAASRFRPPVSGCPSPWGAQVRAILPRSAPHTDACFSDLQQRQTVSLSPSRSRLLIVAPLPPLVSQVARGSRRRGQGIIGVYDELHSNMVSGASSLLLPVELA